MILTTLAVAAVPAPAQTQAGLNRQTSAAFAQADAALNAQWRRTYTYMKRRDVRDPSRGGAASAMPRRCLPASAHG